MSVPRHAVARCEVGHKRSRAGRIGRGAAFGEVLGAVLGFGIAQPDQCSSGLLCDDINRSVTALATVGLAGAGGLLGRWRTGRHKTLTPTGWCEREHIVAF